MTPLLNWRAVRSVRTTEKPRLPSTGPPRSWIAKPSAAGCTKRRRTRSLEGGLRLWKKRRTRGAESQNLPRKSVQRFAADKRARRWKYFDIWFSRSYITFRAIQLFDVEVPPIFDQCWDLVFSPSSSFTWLLVSCAWRVDHTTEKRPDAFWTPQESNSTNFDAPNPDPKNPEIDEDTDTLDVPAAVPAVTSGEVPSPSNSTNIKCLLFWFYLPF